MTTSRVSSDARTVSLPRLHPAQRVIVQDQTRFRVVRCGRRFGKTTLAVSVALQEVLAGRSVAFMTPEYRGLRDILQQCYDRLQPITKTLSLSNFRVEALTGGVLECWSLTYPDSIRGRSYHTVIIDEAAYVRDLASVFDRVIRPMLVDYRGRALFLSTPRGYNDFYTLHQNAETLDDWRSFHYATWDNPHIPPDEIEAERLRLPAAIFDEEFAAQFRSRAGLVFDTWDDALNVTDEAVYDPTRPVYWGVDDGYVHGEGLGTASYHPRVFLFVQQDARGRMIVFDEYSATHELAERSVDVVLNMPYQRPIFASVDSSAQELRARLHARGIQTINGTHRIENGISLLQRYVADGRGERLLLVNPKCTGLIYNFNQYAYDKLPSGDVRPGKLNDDYLDALRYIVYRMRENA